MLAAACCLLLIAPFTSIAQNKQYTDNQADQTLRSQATIDPSTLGMSIHIPLGTYPGRAGTNLPVTIDYSSKVWRIKYVEGWPGNPGYYTQSEAMFAERSAAGWTSNLNVPRLEFTGDDQRFTSLGNPITDEVDADPYAPKYYVRRINIHMPDGSVHELRKGDDPQYFDSLHPYYDFTGNFYAVDGSRLRYDFSTNTLYMPDGGRYSFGPRTGEEDYFATGYVDRNGNSLSFYGNQWTDTLGRVVSAPLPVPAPTATPDVTYSLTGYGGNQINYTLRWRYLSDVRTDPSQPLRYAGNFTWGQQWQSPSLFSSYSTDSICASGLFNPVVLSEVVLPTGQSYRFTYNVWGEIDKVYYPTGGYERYRYDKIPPLGHTSSPYDESNRGVVERWVSAKGDGTDEVYWHYSGGTTAITYAPDGTRIERLLHTAGSPTRFGFDDPRAGMAYEERVFSSSNVMLRRKLTQWDYTGPAPGGNTYAKRNPRVAKEVEIILDTGGNALAKTTVYGYDTNYQYDVGLDQTSVSEYDFASVISSTAQTAAIGSIPTGSLLRATQTTYLTSDANYRNLNILGLPNATFVQNASGITVARTEMRYDEAAYPLLSYGLVTGWNDPGTTVRGLATTSRHWLDTTGVYLESHAQYDQCGSLRKNWDAKGNLSQIEYSSASAYAYPVHTISPIPDTTNTYGSNTSLETWMAYDPYTGLVTSTTDANNQVTNYYYDSTDGSGAPNPLRRLSRVILPDGGQTAYSYGFSSNAGYNNFYVRKQSTLDASRWTDFRQFYDGLGRESRTLSYDGGSPVFITADTQYDQMGRVWRVSNPYRTNGPGDGINPSGQWTTTVYDALGRILSVTTPDNAVVNSSYLGNTVTVSDQKSRARKSITDALGRLSQVIEDPSGAAYQTNYVYDVLGNLHRVEQGGQYRYFMYDSLSRLIRAKNPEQNANSNLALTDPVTNNSSWSISYAYDANGNLQTRTDARNITATYAYDTLNRNIITSYSDGVTAYVGRVYDKSTNGKGRLAWNWNDNGGPNKAHTYISVYDAMGRVRNYQQFFWINGNWNASYAVSRSYDLAGHVTSQTYPSGHTVSYSYDAAGRTQSFTGNLGDGTTRNYATAITYNEWGMAREQFGTQTPTYHKQHYNVRGQLWDIRLSTVNDESNWNRGAYLLYYSSVGGYNGGASNTDNNGNVLRSQSWIPSDDQITNWSNFDEWYDYDQLNRLQKVTEYPNNGFTATFAQAYSYDRWGNRQIDSVNTWGTGIPKPQFTVDTATNRLGVPGGQNGSMAYDYNGNLTTDTYMGTGTRTFDDENRMISALNTTTNQTTSYTYDADGRRVRRNVNGAGEVWQVYGIDGELLAEYASNAAPTAPQKEYGYRNNQLLITATPATGGGGQSTQNVTWQNAVGVTASANNLTKSAQTAWGNSGASSTQAISSGDGYVEFTVNQTSNDILCGLSHGDSDQGYADIDFALYLSAVNSRNIYVDENGSLKGPYGTYTAGDRFRVAVESGAVKYYKVSGGTQTLLYTSSISPTYPLLADTSLYATGNDVTNVVLSGNLGGGTPSDVEWLVADQLGTPRIVIEQSGSLAGVKRHDYLPFGEELYAGMGGRTTQQGYVADGVRQKFGGGYERDSETGLDYAQARYYSSAQGRFTSVDPSLMSAKSTQPQSWNRYSYCINSPLKWIDPSGLSWFYKDRTEDGHTVRTFYWYEDDKEAPSDLTIYTEPLFYGGPDSSGGQRIWLGPGGSYSYLSEDEYDEAALNYAETGDVGFMKWWQAGLLQVFLFHDNVRQNPGGISDDEEEEPPLFSQKTASEKFQEAKPGEPPGPFAGMTIGEVAAGLRSGKINPSQLPFEVINRDGQILSLNTRSLLALRRAGISPSEYVLKDLTGNAEAEEALTQRLLHNKMTTGSDVIRVTGAGTNASSIK